MLILHSKLKGTSESKVDKPTTDPIQSSVVTKNIGTLRFNEATFVTAHNAHANTYAAGDNMAKQLATNQQYSIYRLLKYVGVRGLMLDIEYDFIDNAIRLIHGSVDFNSFEAVLVHEIIPFLDEDLDAVITIDLESKGDIEMLREGLYTIFHDNPTFADRIFRILDPRWKNHKEWPLINELRKANQRILILADNRNLQSEELGIMWRNDLVIENHWQGGLGKCTNRNGSELDATPWGSKTIVRALPWPRLFTMNHFCCTTGIGSFERTRENLPGGGDNGWGMLYPRILMCMAANGHHIKPTFIAIDWAHLGDAFSIAEYLSFGGKIGGLGKFQSEICY